MWEAARLPYEDCDKVPLILRSFDHQLRSFLLQNAPSKCQTVLEGRIRLQSTNVQENDVTGKQCLSFLVSLFGKSPSVVTKEAYDALGTFKVKDPNCPHSWQEAFFNYELRIKIAHATSIDPEVKALLLLASLEHDLLRSDDYELVKLQGNLESKMRETKLELPASQQLKWYRDEIKAWGSR